MYYELLVNSFITDTNRYGCWQSQYRALNSMSTQSDSLSQPTAIPLGQGRGTLAGHHGEPQTASCLLVLVPGIKEI